MYRKQEINEYIFISLILKIGYNITDRGCYLLQLYKEFRVFLVVYHTKDLFSLNVVYVKM